MGGVLCVNESYLHLIYLRIFCIFNPRIKGRYLLFANAQSCYQNVPAVPLGNILCASSLNRTDCWLILIVFICYFNCYFSFLSFRKLSFSGQSLSLYIFCLFLFFALVSCIYIYTYSQLCICLFACLCVFACI